MNLVTVREIYRSREAYLDKEIQIGGWVRSVRGSKAFGFVVVSDGSYFETLQIVYHDTLENFSDISKLNVGLPSSSKVSWSPRRKQNSLLKSRLLRS